MCKLRVDQPERSGIEYWHLLTPKLKQRQELVETGRWSDHTLKDLVSSDEFTSKIDAFHRLARPTKTTLSTSGGTSTCEELVTSRTSLSIIEALSAELFALILADDGLDKQDILGLGACSKTAWIHVERHIRDDCRKGAAPWAGTPLIATGNWLRDLPQAVYDIFPEVQERDRQWHAGEIRRFGMCPSRRWNWGAETDYEDVTGTNPGKEWLKAAPVLKESSALKKSLEEAVSVVCPQVGEKWLLRNLSTSEFVRLEIVSEGMEGSKAVVAGNRMLPLNTALLLKIIWSRPLPGYVSRKGEGHITRGEWAGNSFDVVRDEATMEGWTDVTLALLSQAAAAFEELER